MMLYWNFEGNGLSKKMIMSNQSLKKEYTLKSLNPNNNKIETNKNIKIVLTPLR